MWEFLELILEMKEKVCSKAVRNALIAGLVMAPVAGNASVIGDTWEAFTKNDKITIATVNYLKSTEDYVKTKDKSGKTYEEFAYQTEWGQSVGVFYNSGMVPVYGKKVRARLNVGYSHMFKLLDDYTGGVHNWNAGQKIFKSKDCFQSGTQYKCADTEGFGKVPVASATIGWGKGNMEIGRGFFNAGMITTSNPDDATMSSYEGVMFKNLFTNDYGRTVVDGALVNGFMAGNEDEMGSLTGGSNYYDTDPLEYDYLYTARVRHNFDKASVSFGYGEASDYLRRFYTDAWYRHDIDAQTFLRSNFQYYYNRSAGHLWEEDVEKGMAAFDEYASILSYDFTLRRDAVAVMYGYSTVSAPNSVRDDKYGSFSYGFGNAKGYLKLPTTGGYHGFRGDGTDAHVIALQYDLRHFGLQDLVLAYRYHWAERPTLSKHTDYDHFVMGSAEEHVVEIKYEPKAGPLKGFYTNFKQSFFRPDADYAQLEATDPSYKADNTAIKFTLGYSFQL